MPAGAQLLGCVTVEPTYVCPHLETCRGKGDTWRYAEGRVTPGDMQREG